MEYYEVVLRMEYYEVVQVHKLIEMVENDLSIAPQFNTKEKLVSLLTGAISDLKKILEDLEEN